MTASTGQRSYRACLRCRRRKIRCHFDEIGEPKKAPCVSCHSSRSECILADSRRGGDFRHKWPRSSAGNLETLSPSLRRRNVPEKPSLIDSRDSANLARDSSSNEDSSAERESDGVLAMELRNPSDALQILARSEETQMPDSVDPEEMEVNGGQQTNTTTPAFFENYELVQRGLLCPSLVSELLSTYHQKYHPYFPIVPSHFLEPGSMGEIQKQDHFLLTAILTIASRDNNQLCLTHRYCWDHAQRLLIDVVLAHPWTQTPRTVEGLLILAEWLPHIQMQATASESLKSLFSEDRTAWSLVGLAVRQGYLQQLDQGAFRTTESSGSKGQTERNRLIWTYIFMADRQISVRLGQSFWSRGPSLSSNFTAEDFPSLQPLRGSDNEDYASLLQASMELTQLLHNAHAVLYPSKDRTMAMVLEGNYARYLDDFRTSATTWHTKWSSIAAVLTRAAIPGTSTNKEHHNKRTFTDFFAGGVMLSPDGRYIFDAISAAMNVLNLMNCLDPRQVICYLPSRYYLYGVHAAVLLHKAYCAGAFQTADQREDVTILAQNFIAVMKSAPSTDSHLCHNYARMLKQLWDLRKKRTSQSARNINNTVTSDGNVDTGTTDLERHVAQRDLMSIQEDFSNRSYYLGASPMADSAPGGIPSIEDYLLGSFMPGVADFSTTDFDTNLGRQYHFMSGSQNWAMDTPDIITHGHI